MNLKTLFKQLKTIEPDAAYTARSRRTVLGLRDGHPVTAPTFWDIIVRGLTSGSSIALGGILLLIIAGAFSFSAFLSPFELSGLDPTGLRAEAQAVDIQIQLTDIPSIEFPAVQSTTAAYSREEFPTLPVMPDAPVSPQPSEQSIEDALDILTK